MFYIDGINIPLQFLLSNVKSSDYTSQASFEAGSVHDLTEVASVQENQMNISNKVPLSAQTLLCEIAMYFLIATIFLTSLGDLSN